MQRLCPIVYVTFHSADFAIKSRNRRKPNKCKSFLAPIFREGRPQFVYGRLLAVPTIHCLAKFGRVLFADLCLQSLEPGNAVECRIYGPEVAKVGESGDAVYLVAIDRYCRRLSPGAKVLKLGFWPRNSETKCTGCLTETRQAGDSICSGFEEKGSVVSINQVSEMVSADFDSGFC